MHTAHRQELRLETLRAVLEDATRLAIPPRAAVDMGPIDLDVQFDLLREMSHWPLARTLTATELREMEVMHGDDLVQKCTETGQWSLTAAGTALLEDTRA